MQKTLLKLFTKWLNHYLKYHDIISPDNLVELIIDDKEIKPMLETAMKRHDEEQQQIGIQKGILEGELQDKQSILIRQLDRKFGLTSVEKAAIMKCKNRNILDKALEEILFAETKGFVLSLLQ